AYPRGALAILTAMLMARRRALLHPPAPFRNRRLHGRPRQSTTATRHRRLPALQAGGEISRPAPRHRRRGGRPRLSPAGHGGDRHGLGALALRRNLRFAYRLGQALPRSGRPCPYLSWSATLAMPALPQSSSCCPPLGAPERPTAPTVSLPILIGVPPCSGMTSDR